MSELLETLRQEGVDPALLSAVEEYRAAHPLDAALRPRIPAPAFTYYGKGVERRGKGVADHHGHAQRGRHGGHGEQGQHMGLEYQPE